MASPDTNIKHLQAYINQQNVMRGLFGDELITTHVRRLTQDDADVLVDQLEGDLSPENLACDGEISGAQIAVKLKYLKTVEAALIDLGFDVDINI